ncbi:hypothetical protein ACLB2K_020918 [Fragaria x ananassa]
MASLSFTSASSIPSCPPMNKNTKTPFVSEKPSDDTSDTQKSGEGENGEEGDEEKQEMDWKTDEEFKRFMGNPSIEAAIKLEKKRADRKLKDLDRESSDNPIVGLLNRALRDSLTRERDWRKLKRPSRLLTLTS